MKKRTITTMMILAMVSGIFTGCGAKETTKVTPVAKAEKASDIPEIEGAEKNVITIDVTANEGWDGDSTPAILHITSVDVENAEFYHAIYPDGEGGTGTTAVELAEGTYDLEFISPLNTDGSAYEIYEMGGTQELVVDLDFGKDMTITCDMKQIPADQVTDEMIQDIVSKTQAAIEKGDDTLKGDAGKQVLEHLAQNVAHSPNASDATKEQAQAVKENTTVEEVPVKAEEKAENNAVQDNVVEDTKQDSVQSNTKQDGVQDNNQNNNVGTTTQNNVVQNTAQNNNVGTTTQNNNQNNVVQNKPVQSTPVQNTPVQNTPVQNTPVVETPAHTHTWADHVATKQEWVANMVTVPDYETQSVQYHVCNCGAEFIIGVEEEAIESHVYNHIIAGEDDGCWFDWKTTTVQVGSHQEDQGYYKDVTYVDYQYCTGCGEHR